MNNLDHAIRDALSKEDAEFLARLDQEQSPFREAMGTFSGKWGTMNVFAALVTFAMFGLFVYCAWNAVTAVDARATVIWSAGALWAALAIAMLKMYFWMEMNKNVVLREVKRLELQVARLVARDAA
jgi:hypothetical protein